MTQPFRPRPRGDSRLDARLPRRVFLERTLRAGTLGAAALWTPGVLAEELIATPSSRSLEGPFYPDEMPLDTDNDLLIVNDSITPAVGEVTSPRHGHDPRRHALAQRVRRDLAVRHERRTGTRSQRGGAARFELPGLRPLSHERAGRVLLSHHQAGPVHHRRYFPHPAHHFAAGTCSGSSRQMLIIGTRTKDRLTRGRIRWRRRRSSRRAIADRADRPLRHRARADGGGARRFGLLSRPQTISDG